MRVSTRRAGLCCVLVGQGRHRRPDARAGPRLRAAHPGFIDTPLFRSALTRFGDPAEGRRQYDALQPLGHIGEPDDVAWGVLYLASDESKFVTGSELVIDGGYTAR